MGISKVKGAQPECSPVMAGHGPGGNPYPELPSERNPDSTQSYLGYLIHLFKDKFVNVSVLGVNGATH